jgi:hypothetical protein
VPDLRLHPPHPLISPTSGRRPSATTAVTASRDPRCARAALRA